MSVQALGAVLDHSESEKGTRLVAISIGNHVDKNGVGFAPVRLIAEESKLEERAVKYAIKKLRVYLAELVVLVEADGKTHRPPLYWLNLPGLSGDCPDSHDYFRFFGPRAEIAPGGGANNAPGPGADAAPEGGHEMHPGGANDAPPGCKNAQSPHIRVPSLSRKTEDPEDDKSPSGDLSNLLADLIAKNDPNGKRPTVTKAWLNAERLLLEVDEREYNMAERLIRWCQASDFWRPNILSMPKFRQQYGRLFLQAGQGSIEQRRNAGADQEHPADKRIRESREARERDEPDETIDGDAEEER